MKIRLFLAVLLGKAAIILSRLAGNQGTNLPGRIARMIYPPILTELAVDSRQGIIIITGTNGKTTTSNILAAIIKEEGCTLVHNQEGANLITGITTAFISAAKLFRRPGFDYAVLETDEANIPLLLNEIHPRAVLVTNFFQDQVDRFGELSHTIQLIKDTLKKQSDMELILNADDPLLADFEQQTGKRALYYGFAATPYDTFTSGGETVGRFCTICGQELDYRRYHYAQLGKYHCSACNNHNPPADYIGSDLQMTPEIVFKINDLEVKSLFQGFYNAYNILAAAALAKYLGMDDFNIKAAIMKYQPQAGRMEKFVIDDRICLLVLVKNPTGFNQVLKMIVQDPLRKGLFIALNDNAGDGRDISWIWDAEAELLQSNANITKIVCAGLRSADMALRIKYAGIGPEYIKIASDLRPGIEETLSSESETSYILCTYSALFDCQKILTQMQERSPGAQEGLRVKAGSN